MLQTFNTENRIHPAVDLAYFHLVHLRVISLGAVTFKFCFYVVLSSYLGLRDPGPFLLLKEDGLVKGCFKTQSQGISSPGRYNWAMCEWEQMKWSVRKGFFPESWHKICLEKQQGQGMVIHFSLKKVTLRHCWVNVTWPIKSYLKARGCRIVSSPSSEKRKSIAMNDFSRNFMGFSSSFKVLADFQVFFCPILGLLLLWSPKSKSLQTAQRFTQ